MLGRSAILRVLCVALACAVLPVLAGTGSAVADERSGLLELTLDEAIALALENSRSVVSARLGREEQRLSLEAAEERYLPQAGIGASADAAKDEEWAAEVSVGPSLRVPTGGTFRLSLSKPVAGEGERAASMALTFSQPLLRGFGTDIDTAPLRKARLDERINLRDFRDRIAGVRGMPPAEGCRRREAGAQGCLPRGHAECGARGDVAPARHRHGHGEFQVGAARATTWWATLSRARPRLANVAPSPNSYQA